MRRAWRVAAGLALALGCRAAPASTPRGADTRTEVTPDLAPATSSEASPTPPRVDEAEPEPAACALVDPPPGFVDLREEIPSAVIAPGYHGADNFTGAPLPGYAAAGAWLARDAAEALARVAERLAADDLRLIVYDAYRPRRASEAMVAWCRANGREDLLTDGWVARRSAHGRGLAVDVGLGDAQGRALDMGSAWDQFDATSHMRGVDGEALVRRQRLRAELVRVGFVPYAREWWHFGFGDTSRAPILDVAYTCRSR